mgnify:CR=1 FL=1
MSSTTSTTQTEKLDQTAVVVAVVVAATTEVESSKAQNQVPTDMIEEPSSKAIAEVHDQVAGIPAAVVEEPSNAIAEEQIQEQPAVVVAVTTEVESSKAQAQVDAEISIEEPASSSENKRKSFENQSSNKSPIKKAKAKTAEEVDALMADVGSPSPTCGC